MPETSGRRRARWLLAALLTATGLAHVVWPTPFERLVPRWLPGSAVAWNRFATAAELGSAVLLASGRTARAGGMAAFATFAVVWVANVQAALDGGYHGFSGWPGSAAVAWVRVPLQVPLLWWAAVVARRPEEPET